jgi:hypothetical protein
MRVFKRVYCTLVQKQKVIISKVPDMVSLPLVQYIPTFDYIYIPTFDYIYIPPLQVAYG